MALWKEEELEEWWDNVYHTNQLEAGVGPGRAREESQLVWGRQPSERLTEPSWSSSSLRSSLSPRDPEQDIQDDHLQLQWPPELSPSPSPSPSFSAASLLLRAPKPEVIRGLGSVHFLIFPASKSIFQSAIFITSNWDTLAYLWCLAKTSSLPFKWISH